MLRTRIVTNTLMAVLMLGLVSIAAANQWDGYYNQRPNYQGSFTNREAWSANIVGFGPEWFDVECYGVVIRLRLREGSPRLYVGQRVRIVPFARDGEAEIGELRLPEKDFKPVGVVRYIERQVPKEGPRYYDSRPYGGGGRVQFGVRIEKREIKPVPPPVYRRTPAFRDGRWR